MTGAVEGALFVRTRRLVPLSEQTLVDCAHPFGGHGCRGTWPSAAYDYVQERGLPALSEYTPYQGKVLTCLDRRVPPVTHISSHVNVTSHSVSALQVSFFSAFRPLLTVSRALFGSAFVKAHSC